jgi:hypothetical protein
MVDAAVRLNKPRDAMLIEIVKPVNPPPCGEGDARVHVGVGGQDNVVRIAGNNGCQPGDEPVTIPAMILDHDAAIFQVMHLQLIRNGLQV